MNSIKQNTKTARLPLFFACNAQSKAAYISVNLLSS